MPLHLVPGEAVGNYRSITGIISYTAVLDEGQRLRLFAKETALVLV